MLILECKKMKQMNNKNQNGLKTEELNFLIILKFKTCYQQNQPLVIVQRSKRLLFVEEHLINNSV